MSKEALKAAKGIDKNFALVDTHREVPKKDGGTYEPDNYDVIAPRDHMEVHGNLRDREEWMEALKAAFDDRKQVMMLRNKAANQLLAYERKTDHLSPATVEWLSGQVKDLTKLLGAKSGAVEKAVKNYAKCDPLATAALNVHGIGGITVASCLIYIDLTKARHASSLWKYAGLHTSSENRYTKGEAGGGNKTLRTVLYTMADSQIKSRGPYREVYDRTKERLEKSQKMTRSRNTQGKLVECKWCDTKACHRHGAAIRQVMKHFLADWWYVGRDILGLPTDALYAEAILGGNHRTVQPRERGWEW